MTTNEQRRWYVAKSRNHSSVKIKELLVNSNIEHFLPLRKTTVERNGKEVTVLQPLALDLVFLHTDFKTALSLVNERGLPLTYMIDPLTHSLLVVPDKQMQDFMFLMDFSDKSVTFSTERLRKGDRVKVISGEFAGIEGELIRIKGHKRVVVRLEGILSLITTYIPKAYLEKIEE